MPAQTHLNLAVLLLRSSLGIMCILPNLKRIGSEGATKFLISVALPNGWPTRPSQRKS
jgi:hypothetical protein